MIFALCSLLFGAAVAASPVTLTAEDGTRIHAQPHMTAGATQGVVLVHMLGREHSDWRFLVDRLSSAKVSSIAIDLRGHGKSDKAGTDLVNADFLAMRQDVAAAATWLRAHGVDQVSCVGASIGANLCARAGAADPQMVNLILLSPGLNYKGITSGDALAEYGDRPVLIVAAEDDRFSARSAMHLEQLAKGQVHFELFTEAGHGTRMLTRAPSLEGQIVSWLVGSFKLVTGELVRPQAKIERGNDTIETRGRKLGVHQ
jgi:pimeloyl-ACP methyl ester carboxylesterase